jgi:DNA-binding MarR family transcriptional regulator
MQGSGVLLVTFLKEHLMPKTAELPVKKGKVAKEEKKEQTPREPKDLTPNMMKVLDSLKSGSVLTAAEISSSTGIDKGRRLPELVEKGYLQELVAEEGKRGKRFKITPVGRKALEKALKESKS